ncbi:PadR family transcriptional regulator [Modestobacter sp. I12A-02662]|uniref:PadR family transcriptional regulator n=1 Tax=Modestobacter sp. I12A-02662 TaxID=1730496 RepID=UPI0034DF30D9
MAEKDPAPASRLTTTSFALLCLLGVRPWSTYELTRQMDRSLGRMWPRATSKLYEEPKKLARRGLARARSERVGRRVRTVYSITDEGRRALADWLAVPGDGPVLEFEGLLKVGFAEYGTRADTLATLASVREWAAERNRENAAAARSYAAGEGPFQERAAQGALVGGFLTAYYRMVDDWADWATGVVERWPDQPADARPEPGELEGIARRAEW